MRTLLFVFFALLLAPLSACDGAEGATSLRYTVQLLGDGDAVVGTGEIRFNAEPRSGAESTGTFTLQQTGGGPVPPLMTTSGTFRASFEAGGLLVRINPEGTTDIGLQLLGDYSASSYTGTWSEITIAGPQVRGTFTATAVEN